MFFSNCFMSHKDFWKEVYPHILYMFMCEKECLPCIYRRHIRKERVRFPESGVAGGSESPNWDMGIWTGLKISSHWKNHKIQNGMNWATLWLHHSVIYGENFYKLIELLWKSKWQFLRKLGIDLPQDAVVPALSIYPQMIHPPAPK